MHDITDCASGVAVAEDYGDLAVGHHAARWDLADDGVDAFAVELVVEDVQGIISRAALSGQ